MAKTRYPKGGKGRKWTIKELEAIGSQSKGDALADGEGLVGEVRLAQDGGTSVHWRFGHKWAGKKAWHYCGTWPASSMEAVRTERDKARGLLKEGVHPGQERKAAKFEAQQQVEAKIAEAARLEASNLPWRAMFESWLTDGVHRADQNAGLLRAFEKDILPTLGDKPARAVTDTDLRDTLRKVGRGRERARTAEVLLADVRQLYRWAVKRQPWRGLLPDGNPAELVETAQIVPAGYTPTVRDRVLSPSELRELRDKLQGATAARASAPAGTKYGAAQPVKLETQLALWIALGTACRIGELLMARWEHIDLDAGTWRVPAENTKTGVEWMVHLSPFALRHFKMLRTATGHTPWCFPAKPAGRRREGAQQPPVSHVCTKTVSKQVGDRQMQFMNRSGPLKNRRSDNTLVLADAKNGAWTPHDLRRTAATMMQALGVLPDIIDRCQNHVLAGSKVRRHYLHHEYATEKADAWRRLGDHLDAIFAGPLADAPSTSAEQPTALV